jgi:hypothetical protein
VIVDGLDWLLRIISSGYRPFCVVADKGSHQELDSGPVRYGIPGDTFECVETADTDIDVLVTQLVDSARESLGDLAFTADMDLPPGGDRSAHDSQSGKHL